MILDIIFFICMYPVNLILYFVFKSFGKMENMRKKGIYFGLHAPKEESLRETFLELAAEQEKLFMRRMKCSFLATFWIPFINLMISSMSIGFTIWMIWFIGFLGLLELPYILAHQELKRWKREKVTLIPEEERKHYTEIKAVGKVRKVRLLSFLGPIVLSIAAAVGYALCYEGTYGEAFSFIIIVFAAVTILFYLMALWMDVQKVMVISENSDVNLNFARAKKSSWKNLWLFCAWSNTLLTAGFALLIGREEIPVGTTVIVGSILYTVVLLAAILYALKQQRQLEEKYREKQEIKLEPDDDENWILGIIYYNKQDKHAMVETRFGFGTSMNMATPIGKAMNFLGVVAILSVPILCLWMILMEFTPIQLTVKNRVLIAEQLNKDYEIEIDAITGLQLIEECPKMSKYSGTAMDNLYKGSFHITYGSDCEVFLNPENQYFITFCADDILYYMSAAKDEDTLKMYEKLQTLVVEE